MLRALSVSAQQARALGTVVQLVFRTDVVSEMVSKIQNN